MGGWKWKCGNAGIEVLSNLIGNMYDSMTIIGIR